MAEHNESMNSQPSSQDDVAVRYDIHPQGGFSETLKRLFGGDRVLWIIIIALMVISVLVVYSSTAKMAYMPNSGSSTTAFLRRQLIMLVVCVGAIFFFHRINSKWYRMTAGWVFWSGVILTLLAYFVGVKTNDAARWINILGFQFQPSEWLKLGVVMYLAKALAKRQDTIDTLRIMPTLKFWHWGDDKQKRIFTEGTVPLLLPIILSCAVILPAHTSSAVLVGAISLAMLFLGRVNVREIGRIVGVGLAGLLLILGLGLGRGDTAQGRLSTWWMLWTQDRTEVLAKDLTDTERAMIAIHKGGIMGRGAGQSAVRVEMTHPESDYAFAFFAEEYGFVMAMILLALYLWVFFRAIDIFDKCPKKFPSLLALGIALMITGQALMHIMVTVNILPETGQNLPLISRGGSSLLFTSVGIGMLLSVSRQTEEGSHTTD